MNTTGTRVTAGTAVMACVLLASATAAQADCPAVVHFAPYQEKVGKVGENGAAGVESVVSLAVRNSGPVAATSVKVSGKVTGEVKSLTFGDTEKVWGCIVNDPGEAKPPVRSFECATDTIAVDQTRQLVAQIMPIDHWLIKVSVDDLRVSAANLDPTSNAAAPSVPVLARGTPGGLAGTSSTFTSTATPPATSWKQFTFPITFNDFPAGDGYFVAQQFSFTNGTVAYIGLQPFPGGRMHALFSVFGEGTKSADAEHCHTGADGGSGTSCNVPGVTLVRGHRYELTVTRDEPEADKVTWRGYLYDGSAEPAQAPVQLGAWTLDTSVGDLAPTPGAFVEYYLGGMLCENLPPIDVVIGAPEADSATVATSVLEYGECKGDQHYWAEQLDGGGARIKVGRQNDR